MQTSLPDLPFTNYANAELDSPHSSGKSTLRAFPRTDLKTLVPWTSFPNDIHQAIQSATARLPHLHSTPFTLRIVTDARLVENEEMLRAHAIFALHDAVEQVLARLGVNGRFALPGGGKIAIVGDPDFSWITRSTGWQHPKLIVEYKTWWAANLTYVAEAFNGTRDDTLSKQSLEALQQIYGYMTFNNNKFGILTNWQRALFLCRIETSNRKTLQYYLIELDRPVCMSMLKAWVGMVLLAEADWFYASPTISSGPPGLNFGTSTIAARKQREKAFQDAQKYRMLPDDGTYKCITLDFRLCCFNLSSARRGSMGCVVDAQFLTPSMWNLNPKLHVICKVVDVLRYPDAADFLVREVRAYAALERLQGIVIPKLYGFYEVWGVLRLIALEPVGNAIPEEEQINQTLRTNMKTVLRRIHLAGFIHGDIARRNFCRRANGVVFLVDLERCRRFRNQSELDNEMNEVDGL
ncbi:hypothetical protein APHAL10511_002883 [Amanita phalloides]|nr:hypothetical protein APHAL10511_002883 [Amanita phalloides]